MHLIVRTGGDLSGPARMTHHGGMRPPLTAAVALDAVPTWTTAIVATIAALAVLGPTWRLVRVAVTGVHEVGHAVAGLAVGARVTGIRLETDTSGRTEWTYTGEPGRLRRAWVAWWGYPAPPLAGALGAWAVAAGHARPFVAVLAAIVLAVLVWWVRNAWGVVVCVGGAAALGLAAWLGPAPAALAGIAVVVVLVVGGWRTTIEHLVRRRSDPDSDSRQVARHLVVVPAVAVRLTFVAIATLAGAWAAAELAGAVG
jgi:hypothetical protein